MSKFSTVEDAEFRESDVTGTTEDDIEDAELNLHVFVFTDCDYTKGDLMGRYLSTVKRLAKQVDGFHRAGAFEMYHFQPVLVAKDVTAAVLEELPTLVGDKHVKAMVEEGELWITNLSNGGPHGAGVSNIAGQAEAWSNLLFDCRTGAVISSTNGRRGLAPDLAIQIAAPHLQPGVAQANLVIIELEVSNRSIRQMRQDYRKYFDYDPGVYSVVGIKMLAGEVHSPCQRALAVQWTRLPQGGVAQGGVVEVAGCWDFGMLKLSHSDGTMFSEIIESALPPVARATWTGRRHVPVPGNALPALLPHDAPNPAVPAAAAAGYIRDLYPGHADATLYGGIPPRVRFDATVLNSFRHNIPPGEPAIQDFVLNLGRLFYVVQRTAPRP